MLGVAGTGCRSARGMQRIGSCMDSSCALPCRVHALGRHGRVGRGAGTAHSPLQCALGALA
eukprot:3468828-Alexandrium_andersonii.AAC.1